MRNPFAPIRRRASSLKPDGSRGRMTAGWRVPLDVIPAKAGTQFAPPPAARWIPAFAGITAVVGPTPDANNKHKRRRIHA